MITGDPDTGKNIALRLLKNQLSTIPDAIVGAVAPPQSRTMDFYRKVEDLFGVEMLACNRWGGFKTLRNRWSEHIAITFSRPVLLMDEAHEVLTNVLTELRTLTSKDLDSRQLFCVVLAGNARLVERTRNPELQPLGSHIRRRLVLDYATPNKLGACLEHLLEAAGSPSLMTHQLVTTGHRSLCRQLPSATNCRPSPRSLSCPSSTRSSPSKPLASPGRRQ